MNALSDAALRRLRDAADAPDLARHEVRDHRPHRTGRDGHRVPRARSGARHEKSRSRSSVCRKESPDVAARMLREARTLAQLEHPGIVPVHDVGTLADGRVFYAMKLVRGAPLDALPATPLAERLRIVERICEAVAFAHAHGVIHRDLKPQNVMVGPFGEVLVMDWGVAKLTGDARVVVRRRRRHRHPATQLSPIDRARRRARHAGLHGAGAGRRRSGRSSTHAPTCTRSGQFCATWLRQIRSPARDERAAPLARPLRAIIQQGDGAGPGQSLCRRRLPLARDVAAFRRR